MPPVASPAAPHLGVRVRRVLLFCSGFTLLLAWLGCTFDA